ncbi:614/534 cytochrome P450 [Rickenella mellea]|uniref:614/534 cytochrome P450 n=1 Tax=Rickenella mellea TaxID=50990 RepID=A0A4Y7QG54_9AGAM|nr:614/534 cytochrome P450 [Rickenella mellea]
MADSADSTLSVLVFSALAIYTIRLFIAFRRNVRAVGNHPGYRTILFGNSFIANLLPRIPGVTQGRMTLWRLKHKGYQMDDPYFCYSFARQVYMWPKSSFGFRMADAAAIKEVTSSRTRWTKAAQQYQLLRYFGDNILITEGDEWKRHRRTANPAFSERNNRMVWNEAVRIVNDMFKNDWQDRPEIVVENCVDITMRLALLVIGSAGFGRSISWESDLQIPPGHHMSFKDALHVVSTGLFWKLVIPEWAMCLTQKWRTINQAFSELDEPEKISERHDLFSNLLVASEEEADGSKKLSDSDLRGNIFIFMLGGHETTAHTLCFCFGLLALYQDEQDNLFQHINSVLSDGRPPTYEDMGALTYSLAVLYETLRLFPPVIAIPKTCAEATTLATSTSSGERRVVAVPKGSLINLHIAGLHCNPKYWKDPLEFRPRRFLEDYNRDAFLPFSGGARSCIGRRYIFETESIAFLTKIIQNYKIEVKEEPQFAHETFAKRRERVLDCKYGITLSIKYTNLSVEYGASNGYIALKSFVQFKNLNRLTPCNTQSFLAIEGEGIQPLNAIRHVKEWVVHRK